MRRLCLSSLVTRTEAQRAPRRFNNSLGQQFLYFLPNKLHVNQIKSPGGSRYGANLGIEKLEQTRWLYVAAATPQVLH